LQEWELIFRLADPDLPAAFVQCGTKNRLVKDLGSRWNGVGYAFVLLMLIVMLGCQTRSQKQVPANSQTWSVSGTISPATSGRGATVTLSGAASAATTADPSGNYIFTGLGNGSYTVTPSKYGSTFTPASESTTVSGANVTGVNFTSSSPVVGVDIYPATDIAKVVNASPAGTIFVIHPGTYRLTQSIIPKNGDSFIGQTSCAPPATSCPAIISGGVVIGPSATFDGTNYKVIGQTQQGSRGVTGNCDTGWEGCIYPEDLFFDGVPYKHLYSSTLPAIGPGQWWFDYTNHIIYFHDNPSGHVVETSVLNNAFGGSANNVTIQYLTIEEFADMYPTGAIGVSRGINALIQGANWTVQNCEVTLNHGIGVRVGYRIQILNNYIHDNGQVGIGGGIGTTSNPATQSTNSGVLIQGNTINHNDYAHFNPGFGSGGFKVGATSGITLRGNTIQNNEGSGIHFDMYSQNAFVDGNIITNNSDGDGLVQEIGYGTSTFRNNIVRGNGVNINGSASTFQIATRASSGVNAYCNVMEIPNASRVNGWGVGAANRGNSNYPPYQYLTATRNSFHHNTLIWDAGAVGAVGLFQNDAMNQPNFFANNTPPDYNNYHLSSTSAPNFIYDNNNSRSNKRKTFTNYQASHGDVHSTVGRNNASGYPTVSITSPSDQSSVSSPVKVTAAASDNSGVRKVEFYVDWNLQATLTSSPYNFSWTNGTTGPHTVAAMAYSNAGIRACYAVTLNEQ
jgi:Bacterial Ig domain/Right handed beta helix region